MDILPLKKLSCDSLLENVNKLSILLTNTNNIPHKVSTNLVINKHLDVVDASSKESEQYRMRLMVDFASFGAKTQKVIAKHSANLTELENNIDQLK